MKIHFIGIGGIGVSSLAQYYLSQGADVTGSDLAPSEITNLLAQKGAKLFIGENRKENISEDLDLVIFSPAVRDDNSEFKQAQEYKLEILSYPQALGRLSKNYFTIAISGSHGKSTTSAMISLILIKAGLDPTVILGTKLKEFGDSNFRLGSSNYLVIEADEYQVSFLNYWPNIIVLTNIEEEHIDFFGSLENIFRAFHDYLNHLHKDGCLVVNYDDKNAKEISQSIDVKGLDIRPFSLMLPEVNEIKNIIKVPGDHNISNALGALIAARALGIPDKISLEALGEYQGAWRRFDMQEANINDKKFTIVSDYAHHPTEIKATLKAVREKWPDKNIWAIFQPHQRQRTFYLFKKLVKVFVEAKINKIVLVPIYDVAGREEEETKEKVSSLRLIQAIKEEREREEDNILYISSIEEAKLFLEKNIQGGEIVMIMGAGNIYELSKMFST
ncbi:MAG: UDP-N-acetylmuramate--L-alanine ligase [Patescibacteria group bacterium]|nr:UDP-N-acetylmuramate--L-alanine ligase [Patescibacteria group bacterium]